jgi:hypothetical protein
MISGLVIAGNARQYLDWLKENGLSKQDYKYIHSHEDYCGYHNIPIFLVGEYFNNQCYTDLIAFKRIVYLQD